MGETGRIPAERPAARATLSVWVDGKGECSQRRESIAAMCSSYKFACTSRFSFWCPLRRYSGPLRVSQPEGTRSSPNHVSR